MQIFFIFILRWCHTSNFFKYLSKISLIYKSDLLHNPADLVARITKQLFRFADTAPVNIIYDCIKEGALIQVNSSSIIGKNGKEAERVSEILLNNNMIHFIATDAHSSTRRRPIIRETYDYIVRKYGEQKAEMLFIQNPYKVIEDKEISIESPRKYEKSKGFFKKLFKK